MKEYILNEINGFTLKSTLKSAKTICKGFPITHIPITDDVRLVGCLSERDIQTAENDETLLVDYMDLLDFFYVNDDISLLELIKQFAEYDTNIVPVLDKDKNYLGYFDLADILDLFSEHPFLYEHGILLVVEKAHSDYSFSEVAQIIESNKGKILGQYISQDDGLNTQITIKIVSDDINEIIQTFRRYNYNVLSNHEDDYYLQDLRDRSEYLQKYLDM